MLDQYHKSLLGLTWPCQFFGNKTCSHRRWGPSWTPIAHWTLAGPCLLPLHRLPGLEPAILQCCMGHHAHAGGGGPGEGGRGSRGEAPPLCRNIPNPQGAEKLLENEQLSTRKCHVVGRKQRKFIIECQFRVPTSHQYTTTTTKQDIHHLMPNDRDLSCLSELDSPELEPPSVVELEMEPDDDDEPESLPKWKTSDKLSDSASSSTDSGSEGTSAFCLL